jgi:hypothetical protein
MIIFGTDQMDKFHEILLVQGIFHPRLQSYGSVDSDKNNLIWRDNREKKGDFWEKSIAINRNIVSRPL